MVQYFLQTGLFAQTEGKYRALFGKEAHFITPHNLTIDSALYFHRLGFGTAEKWKEMSVQGIIGPLFFGDAEGRTVTVNQQRYQNVLKRSISSLQQRCADTIIK